jgi:LCP family protein required for cell wall assembly
LASPRRARVGVDPHPMSVATPPAPTPRRRRRRRPRGARPWIAAAAVLVVLLLTIGGAVAGGPRALLLDAAGGVLGVVLGPAGRAGKPLPRGPFTVLVMGTEKTKAFGGMQTDSMIVAGYDPQRGLAAVLSVPRDLWVDIPGYGYQRINSALEFGGPSLAEQTVGQTIGVPIDYYAVVSYSTLVDIVNAVGGIRVDVPYNIDDHCFPNPAENACTTFQLSKGWHTLNGLEALKFAREREVLPLSDISRDADQQAILFALRRKLLTPWGLLKLPLLAHILAHGVTTNFPLTRVPQIAAQLLALPRSHIRHAVLQYSNGAVSNWTTPGGAEVLLGNPQAIQAVVTQLFGPMLPALRAEATASASASGTAA